MSDGSGAIQPKLSVVLPTFNRASVLGRAISSVLAQSAPDIELIVIDDCSTDDTQALLRGIADPRIVYRRHEPNRGGNHARNRGIEETAAPIVSFLDSDDEFLPDKAAFVLDFFARHPQIDGLLDSHLLIRDGKSDAPPALRQNPADLDPANFRRGIFRGTLSKPTPAISARRQALLEIGLFDENLRRRQDMDLLLRLSRAHACASTDRILWRKHWVGDAISAERDTFIAATLAICDRHPEYLAEPDYREGLDRDLVRHFAELAAEGRWRLIARDIAIIRRDGRIGVPPLRLWRRGLRIFRQRFV